MAQLKNLLDGDGVEYSEKVFDTDNSTTDLGSNPFVSENVNERNTR